MQEDSHLTEEALRQALSRLGAESSPTERPREAANSGDMSMRSSQPSRVTPTFSRKRRTSSDHQVIVERAPQGRKAQGAPLSRHGRSIGTTMVDEQGSIERLRNELREEKRLYRETLAENAALKQRLQRFETRLAHYRIQVDEQQKACAEQQEETLRVKAELHHVRKSEKVVVRRPYKKRKKEAEPVQETEHVEQVDAQQPVQWWKD